MVQEGLHENQRVVTSNEIFIRKKCPAEFVYNKYLKTRLIKSFFPVKDHQDFLEQTESWELQGDKVNRDRQEQLVGLVLLGRLDHREQRVNRVQLVLLDVVVSMEYQVCQLFGDIYKN